jgi:hypothetical protein
MVMAPAWSTLFNAEFISFYFCSITEQWMFALLAVNWHRRFCCAYHVHYSCTLNLASHLNWFIDTFGNE